MKNKQCKSCGSPNLISGRRSCQSCENQRVKNYCRSQKGKEVRRKPNARCKACSKEFKAWRKEQVICPDCRKDSLKTWAKNPYIYENYSNQHRLIAEKVLGRKLSYNEVVHHVDENPQNNSLENLWVMSRYHHVKLHFFLRLQRVIYEKSLDKHSVNCWDTLRVDQTTAWLETTGAKVQKLIELGNQQPRA